jgi:hypothetical protein
MVSGSPFRAWVMKFVTMRPARAHPGAVRIEDADYAGIDTVSVPVGPGQGLGKPLGLVVHASRADRIDVAPVVLGLRVHGRVAVDLAGGGEDETGAVPVREAQRVLGSVAAHGQGLEGKTQVVRRRSRAGQMGNGVDGAGDVEAGTDVGLHEREPRAAHQVRDVIRPPGGQVVDACDAVTPGDYRVTQMRSEETGATCHHDSHYFSYRGNWPGNQPIATARPGPRGNLRRVIRR